MKGIEARGAVISTNAAVRASQEKLKKEMGMISRDPNFVQIIKDGLAERVGRRIGHGGSRKKKHIQKYNQKINQSRKQHGIRKNKNLKKTKKNNIQRG